MARLRKSKLDNYVDIVGVLSDKEVADRAGVTPENVRTFRMRRVIAAAWRGETEQELRDKLAAKGQLPQDKPKKRKRRKKRKERASKLDPVKHLLGQIPDRQLAAMAGTSPENVRAYRKRRNIPALWRDAAEAAEVAEAPPKKRGRPAKAKKVKPVKTRATRPAKKQKPAASAPSQGWAWRLVADVGGEKREYVTFGGDMLDAVRRGSEQLGRLKKSGTIVEAHRIAPVL